VNLAPPDPDRLIAAFDRVLRTLLAPATSARPHPGADLPEAEMSDRERRHSAALMRVNHTGEICAQALYQGQALTARSPETRAVLQRAAAEEMDHLAWTARRVEELGGRLSVLNPLFYAGAFTLGAMAGLRADKWNLGFLAETERQVEGHLGSHLDRLPVQDARSRAVVASMKEDEAGHARAAFEHGGADLPEPARHAMRLASRVMTGSAYWV
jgi:ubiquinone biosynthesis monooxygenase Coq7